MNTHFNSIKVDLIKNFGFFWLLTGVGLLLRPYIPDGIAMILSIVTIGLILLQFIGSFFSPFFYMSKFLNSALATLFGISLYTLLAKYIGDLGAELTLITITAAVVTFIVMGVIGLKVQKDLSGLMPILCAAVIGMIIFSIVMMIVGAPFASGLYTALAVFGFGIFSAFTLVEFNMIAKGKYQEMGMPTHAIAYSLYLNLLNMIIDLLRIVWSLTRD